MNRLISSGLMFGNLFHVASPPLVERYNRALVHLTGKQTALPDFYIDISGYSPEIGFELGDPLYLNHDGVNRQFILLSTSQKYAPLLEAKFSTCRGILRQFISQNEAALFALTARDAVAGELVNSVFNLSDPARLLDIRRITIEADTTGGAIRQAAKLDAKVDRFLNEEDAWFDDVLIAEMIELAGETGDIVRNPVHLKGMSFEQGNFWTAHYGGAYLFQDVKHPAILASGDKAPFDAVDVEHVFDMTQRSHIARFLDLNGLVEPIVKARGVDASAVLRQKMDFILVDALADADVVLKGRSRGEMRRLARDHIGQLPQEFHALAALLNWAEGGGAWPSITSNNPVYFYTLRASDHKDAELVNMLLAELTIRDFRQLFICHKPLFYEKFADFSDAKKDYVVEFLRNEYQTDKAGARTALFGHEPSMEEEVRRVGPWG